MSDQSDEIARLTAERDAALAEAAVMREALEAVESGVVLTGQLQEIVATALASPRAAAVAKILSGARKLVATRGYKHAPGWHEVETGVRELEGKG